MKRLVIAFAAAVAACATARPMDDVIASWQGATLDQVIQKWGYPADERVIAGKRILYWDMRARRVVATSEGGPASASLSGSGSVDQACVRMLEVSDGRIVGGGWSGRACPKQLAVRDSSSHAWYNKGEP